MNIPEATKNEVVNTGLQEIKQRPVTAFRNFVALSAIAYLSSACISPVSSNSSQGPVLEKTEDSKLTEDLKTIGERFTDVIAGNSRDY